MTYNELVEKIRKICSKYDASGIKEHLAIQFNIFGEGEGAYYVELADGNVNVEPYEYFDRDILISTTYDIAIKIAQRELDICIEAYSGRLFAEGKLQKSALLHELKEKPAAKKAARTVKGEKKAEKPAKSAKPAKETKAAKTTKAAKAVKADEAKAEEPENK